MKKINHSILIVSVASALVILGASVMLGLRYGVTPGLLTGVGSFTLLIACMLFANRHVSKKELRQKQERDAIWKQIETIAAHLDEKQAAEQNALSSEETAEEQTEKPE